MAVLILEQCSSILSMLYQSLLFVIKTQSLSDRRKPATCRLSSLTKITYPSILNAFKGQS